ncbi:transposase [Streptomyces sp. RPA4-5]|nr:transposase [Streptomyces sp. RPA4-5]
MAAEAKAAGGGHARFAYRLRVSSTACAALESEWDRCRWLWNECVAKSRQVGVWNKTRPEGAEKRTCGPVQLAAMLTEARARTEWLREGACVPQLGAPPSGSWGTADTRLRQVPRQSPQGHQGNSRDHTTVTTSMARKAADAAVGATKAALVEMGRKHGRAVHLVHPAHTTMDCAQCGARTKHALPLSERTYTCTACGVVSPRDKNSARVMLVRAGLQPGWC